MTLYDLLYYINDNCMIELWDENQLYIDIYDDKWCIPTQYEDYPINDIFTDKINEKPIICIEIDKSIDNC